MECFAKYYNKIKIEGSEAAYHINDIFGDTPDTEVLRSFVAELANYLVNKNLGEMVYQIISLIAYAMCFDNNHFVSHSTDEFVFFCPLKEYKSEDDCECHILMKPCINSGLTLALSIVLIYFEDKRELIC